MSKSLTKQLSRELVKNLRKLKNLRDFRFLKIFRSKKFKKIIFSYLEHFSTNRDINLKKWLKPMLLRDINGCATSRNSTNYYA